MKYTNFHTTKHKQLCLHIYKVRKRLLVYVCTKLIIQLRKQYRILCYKDL